MSWQHVTCANTRQFKSVYDAAVDYFGEGKKVDIRIREHQESRREAQNSLQFHWFKEMEMQGDKTAREYRAICKLHFGVPIAREEDAFRKLYDKAIKPLDYESKLELMVEPFNLPVTSQFTIKEMTRYLNAIQQQFASEGIRLTSSDDLYYQAMGYTKKGEAA